MRRALALVLIVVEPLSLAVSSAQHLSTLVERGWLAVAFLWFRLAVTGLGLAAGVALWRRRPAALPLARTALTLALIAAVVALVSPIWPGRPPPGVRGPVLLFVVVWYGAWLCVGLRGFDED